MAGNFPNLMKNIILHIQEAKWTPNRINIRGYTSRHIIYSKCWKMKRKTGKEEKMTHHVHHLEEEKDDIRTSCTYTCTSSTKYD